MEKTVTLTPIVATPESFAEFGQVIFPSGCQAYGPQDAQLELYRGIPRFYIMNLEGQNLTFSKLTHHASVTQCLGSTTNEEWYIGVAKPSLEGAEGHDASFKTSVQSKCGHFYVPPHPDDVQVFRVTGSTILKLNRGTWHAGPLFKRKTMNFYNLELSDTNVVDRTTHDLLENDGVVFLVEV